MTLSTFLIATLIVILAAIFIRMFWEVLLVTFYIVKAVICIGFLSLLSAAIWTVCQKDHVPGEPIGLAWTFFFILYSAILIVYICIIFDIFLYFKGFLQDIFRK